jgi:hypothetical protein
MSKYRSMTPLPPKSSVAPEPTTGRACVSLMSLLLYQHAETAARAVIRVVSNLLFSALIRLNPIGSKAAKA